MAIDASGEGFVSEDQMKASFDRLNVTMNTEQHRELAKILKTGNDNLEYGKLLSLMQANESKGEAEGEEEIFDNPDLDIDANANNGQQDRGDSESSISNLPQHGNSFGSLEYTMSAIDPGGRVLSTLKITEEDFTREEEIRHHYETKYKQYESQITLANSKAKEVYSKYKDSVEKLKQLAAERSKHMKLLKTTQKTAKQAREELVATRDAMANQSKMLTSRVLNLEESLAKTRGNYPMYVLTR